MNQDPLLEQISRLVAEVAALDPSAVRPEGALEEYLDSLQGAEFLFAIEDRFHISVPDDLSSKVKTIADVARFVAELQVSAPAGA